MSGDWGVAFIWTPWHGLVAMPKEFAVLVVARAGQEAAGNVADAYRPEGLR